MALRTSCISLSSTATAGILLVVKLLGIRVVGGGSESVRSVGRVGCGESGTDSGNDFAFRLLHRGTRNKQISKTENISKKRI